jgi:hypothetical protein
MRVPLRGDLPAALLALVCLASEAGAAAEVHRLSLVMSGVPTAISASDFNEQVIGRVNRIVLTPEGFEQVSSIHWGWLFDVQLRYFVRPNVTVEVGVGQLRSQSTRDLLPALNQSIQYRAEILSVPVHVGAAYYLSGYNQGDFQARPYLGGGFISQTYTNARLHAVEAGTDPSTTLRGPYADLPGGTYRVVGRGDSPGYYFESGVHMFFAARYSVLIAVLYRSTVVRDLPVTFEQPQPGGTVRRVPRDPINLDTGGVGGRFGFAVGF